MLDLFVDLDRASPVPLYFQVAQRIERAIQDGELAPGARLDNEVTLAEDLGLSRPTLRRAIQRLVDKGLLVRKRGVGTQVVQGQVTRPVELTSLYDDLVRAAQLPSTRVLLHQVVVAPDDVAAALSLPTGQPVLHVRRLRLAQDEPLALMENYLPGDLSRITAPELAARGLYQLMRSRGVAVRVAKQRIGARRATPEESRLLAEPRGAPLLTTERTAYDDTGGAVELGRHAYRPLHHCFEVTLVQ